MKNRISFIATLLIIMVSGSLFAQNPISLYYLDNIPQSTNINPAKTPRANVFVGFPGVGSIYTRFSSDLFGPDLIQKTSSGYVSLLDDGYDYNKLYDYIGSDARFSSMQSITPFSFGFKGKKAYFSFSWSEKFTETIKFPKDLFSIPDYGLLGNSSLDFSPLAINAQYYRELSFGYAYDFMSNLRIGVHAKLLQGLAAIKTDFNTLKLDVNYEDNTNTHSMHSFDMNGDIYISAPIEIETKDDGSYSKLNTPEMNQATAMKEFVFNFKNPGFAFDIGAEYEYSNEWTFSGSLNDLGFIKWNGNLSTLSMNSNFSYTGFSIDGGDLSNSGDAITNLMDTIKDKSSINVKKIGFSSGLGPKVYLGAEYKVNHYFSAGALSRTMFIKNNFTQEFNVSANLNLYRVLTTSLNYTISTKGASTIGFGFAVRGGPLQLYMVADYLPFMYRSVELKMNEDSKPAKIPYVPMRMDNFNLMFGVNLLFGANGFRDEPMIDAYNEF